MSGSGVFRSWKRRVDELLVDKLDGMDSKGIPDVDYYAMFLNGMQPDESVDQIVGMIQRGEL